MMRVLFLTHQFLPRHLGGTELYTLALARELLGNGAEAQVVTYVESPAADPAEFQLAHTVVQDVPVTEIHYNLSVAPWRARYEYANPFTEHQLDGILRQVRPDLVHATHLMKVGGAALRPALRRRLPIVATLTDFWAVCGRHTLLRSNGQLCRGPRHPLDCLPCLRDTYGFTRARSWPGVHPLSLTLARRALRTGRLWPSELVGDLAAIPFRNPFLRGVLRQLSRIVVLSEFQRRLLVENGLPDHALEVVPHGLEPIPDLGPPPRVDPRRFAFVGSLVPHKGLHILVEALALDPSLEVRLDVYGDSSSASAYVTDLKQRLGSDRRIAWKGSLPPAELAAALRGCAGLVMPAQWYENSPLVVQLALTLGVRVLASRLGTLEEMLAGRPGHLLLPARDATAWAEALRRAISGGLPVPVPVADLPTWRAHARRIFEIYHEVSA